MAIFSKKTEDAAKTDAPEVKVDGTVKETDQGIAVVVSGRANQALVVPRISEKASMLNRLNKYVFRVEGKVNKVELRKAIEKAYGAKVARVNMITVKGKYRRYGLTSGKMTDYKKAIVTLHPDSKKINVIES
jgi:large subunit ribosomal protein L23